MNHNSFYSVLQASFLFSMLVSTKFAYSASINKTQLTSIETIKLIKSEFLETTKIHAIIIRLNDDELQKQILAMDKFVTAHLTKKQLPPPSFNRSEFPDMSILGNIFDFQAGKDKLMETGICAACDVGIGFLMLKVKLNTPEPELERMSIFICEFFRIQTSEVCKGIVERFSPHLYYIFKNRPNVKSPTFCGSFLQSFGCTTNDPYLEWDVDIPSNKREDELVLESELEQIVPINRQPGAGRPIKIVQLADIHYDPLYVVGSSAECDNKILCCHESDGIPLNKSKQAGNFGDARKCDTPTHILKAVLQHIAKEHSDLDYLYMTGDVVPHNVWITSIEDNNKIIKATAEMFMTYLPNAKIIPVLGNHETHPVNLFTPNDAPEDLSTAWLFNSSYDAYKQWIPTNQANLFQTFGYFAIEINPKFKILVMNTNPPYQYNFWQVYEPKDPYDHLKWLIQELQKSEDKKQSVHILGHVPPGHEECFHVWSRNFYNIVIRYQHIIKAQFYGHTHYDEFKIIYDNNSKPINSMWIAPSLTAYEIHNLAYSVYYMDPIDYTTKDHETWSYDLEKQNNDPPNSPIEWFRTYKFTDAFNLKNAKPKSLDILVQRLTAEPMTFKLFHRHFYKSQRETYTEEGCSNFEKKRFLCKLVRYHTSYFEKDNPECRKIHMEVDSSGSSE